MKNYLSSHTAVSTLADLIILISFFLLFNPVASRFATTSSYNAIILGVAFILFCIAVYLLKRLQPQPNVVSYLPEQVTAVIPQRILAVLFAIAFAITLAHQFGYLATLGEVGTFGLDAGEASSLFVYGPGAWLGIGLIYMLILSSTAVPHISHTAANYPRNAFLGLLGVNLMLFLTAAELYVFFNNGSWGWSLVSLLLLGILFLPPRLVYATKGNGRFHLISFGILLIVSALFTISS
ncbi:MAG: hypothetical protein GY943_31800 [Chloroflexi bacterium]|nr:hypothetical protein [Chloroflexota bacterium]